MIDDYVGAAEALIRAGYTTADKLLAIGSSNGGKVVGEAIRQRPNLFWVAVPKVGANRSSCASALESWRGAESILAESKARLHDQSLAVVPLAPRWSAHRL